MNDSQNRTRDELITEFCGLTGAPPREARQYLEANGWDLSVAVTEYFTSQEEDGAVEGDGDHTTPEAYTGPRTLDGRPAPTSTLPTASSSSLPARQPPRTGFATLDTLSRVTQTHGHGHDNDDDNHDDEDYQDDEQPRDLFAGGEKSGLAVQDPRRNDPRNLVNDIIKKAQANSKRPGGEPAPAPPSRFRGTGMTLGGDDVPSQVIPDARASSRTPSGPVQNRVLHLWSNGFSIDDGPLHHFDDPRNAADLAVIRSGRAPIHLMNVNIDQPVDVKLEKHDENYKPPPKIYKPFGGSGHRLGSPTPGSPTPSTASTVVPSAPITASNPTDTEMEINPSQPTVSLRIQLANGTRLPARFNTTHTIGDVYGFIERAYPGTNNRPWVLATTFPNKDHTDRSEVLGDVSEFKKGGTAVQKWI